MEQVGVAPSRTLRSRDTRCCPSSSLGHISRATWPPYPSSAWHWGRWQGWARRGCRPVTTPSWCAVPPNSLWQGPPRGGRTGGGRVVGGRGQVRGKNELGGAQIHARNGVVDDEVESEVEAFARARRFLSYLPSSVHELPPRAE